MNKYIARLNGKILCGGICSNESEFRTKYNIPTNAIVEFSNMSSKCLFNKYTKIRSKILSEEYDYLEDTTKVWIDSTIVAQNKANRDALRKIRTTILDDTYFINNKLLAVENRPTWCKPLVFRYATSYKKAGEQDIIIDEWLDFLNEWVKISK